MADYTMDDLEALAPEWRRVFGEPMPMGFEVTPSLVPLMRRCIRARSQQELDDYVAAKIADGRVY